MNQATLMGRDIYMRHTGTDGKAFVQDHRVWDAARFVARRQEEARNENARVKGDEPRLAKAEQITQEQYRAERRA